MAPSRSCGLALLCLGAQLAAQELPPAFLHPREFHFAAPASKGPSLRVVSWNIDRGTDLDHIVQSLKMNGADLCLFQEVDWGTARAHNADVAEALARRLSLNGSYVIEFEELGQEHGHPAYIGQATLTRLPIRRSRILRFEEQSGFWKPRSWIPSQLPLMQRRLGDRVALVTDLDYKGQKVIVYNTHLESRSYGRIQMKQLEEMLSDLRSNYPANTPVILGGDLNSKYLPSVFLHRLEREGFRSATGKKIERTHTIAMALDWIFVRGLEIENGQVRRDAKGSDHYPVYAEVVLSR